MSVHEPEFSRWFLLALAEEIKPFNLSLLPRGEAPCEWGEVSAQLEYVPIWAVEGVNDYQVSYFSEVAEIADVSFVVFDGKKPQGLFGGLALERSGTLELVSPGLEGFLDAPFGGTHPLRFQVGQAVMTALGAEIDEIWRGVRKSYRPLITRESKRLESKVFCSRGHEFVEVAQRLHLAASGRVTRSQTTWDLQAKSIDRGEGFGVLVELGHIPVGAAYFDMSRDEATYSVAAYDRQLMSEGVAIGHFTLWRAIEHMKRETALKNLVLYRSIADDAEDDAKVRGIRKFKDGFSNSRLTFRCLRSIGLTQEN